MFGQWLKKEGDGKRLGFQEGAAWRVWPARHAGVRACGGINAH